MLEKSQLPNFVVEPDQNPNLRNFWLSVYRRHGKLLSAWEAIKRHLSWKGDSLHTTYHLMIITFGGLLWCSIKVNISLVLIQTLINLNGIAKVGDLDDGFTHS